MITSTGFWVFLFLLGFALLILLAMGKKTDLLNNTVVAVTISMLIALAYFTLINHFLMDSQGLDYWYLFRE
jgi:DMSO reductase anchor subunit